MRDLETIETAIAPRKRGTSSCRRYTDGRRRNDQPDRGVVSPFQQKQIRLHCFRLKAVVSQRLLPARTARARSAAEILRTPPGAGIHRDKDKTARSARRSRRVRELRMQTFDQSLLTPKGGLVTLEEALRRPASDDFACGFVGSPRLGLTWAI